MDEEVRRQVALLQSDVTEIKTALLGNDEFKQEGYLGIIKNNKLRIRRLEQWRNKMVWMVAGAVTLGSFLAFIFGVITKLI